jgi:transcriptional regulator GlxA family with amidase domain
VKTIGIYLWPDMTSLDVLGPHQFFGYVPDFEVVTVAKTKDPVVTDTKIRILPDHDFSTCPPIDILLVGGGVDPSAQMADEAVISWVRETGQAAEYVTSTCTGALILAEAGLLDGYKATTHWAFTQQLATYPGVEPGEGRVVIDRNRITCVGVTASLDFALTVITQLVGPDVAAGLQLMSQYDPQPPTPFGNPDKAPDELVAAVRAQADELSPGLTEFLAAKQA